MKHKFYVIHKLGMTHRDAYRVTPYFGIEGALNSFRYLGMGGAACVMRREDCVIIAQKGDTSDFYPMSEVLKYEEEQLEKTMSKLPSQENVGNFDPPVRTGDTQTQAATLVPTGNISHFEPVAEYNGHQWVTKYNIMKRQGYTFTNGGFATSKCKHCGGAFVVGLCVYFDGAETPFWIDACAGCGHAWEERAVREMAVSNV